ARRYASVPLSALKDVVALLIAFSTTRAPAFTFKTSCIILPLAVLLVPTRTLGQKGVLHFQLRLRFHANYLSVLTAATAVIDFRGYGEPSNLIQVDDLKTHSYHIRELGGEGGIGSAHRASEMSSDNSNHFRLCRTAQNSSLQIKSKGSSRLDVDTVSMSQRMFVESLCDPHKLGLTILKRLSSNESSFVKSLGAMNNAHRHATVSLIARSSSIRPLNSFNLLGTKLAEDPISLGVLGSTAPESLRWTP
ncbi:hypothetical protein PM082_021701, partial [Marasmius tenuissimus]